MLQLDLSVHWLNPRIGEDRKGHYYALGSNGPQEERFLRQLANALPQDNTRWDGSTLVVSLDPSVE